LCDGEAPDLGRDGLARREAANGPPRSVGSDQTPVPLRYLIAFVWPITATIRDFLAAGGHTPAEVDAMHTAWFKAVT